MLDGVPHPYLLNPPQPIIVEIRTSDGGVLVIDGTLDSVPWSAGHVAQRIVVTGAKVKPQE
jgi:hypothetical protein